MSLYEKYTSGWEGISYVTGRDDCYGLVRKWMKKHYDMQLTNYARPLAWDESGMNLLHDFFDREGFQLIHTPLSRLEIGDVLLMRLVNIKNRHAGVPNHIGVYVGNGYVLHHQYGIKSKADALNERWRGRVLDTLRHPDIAAKNAEQIEKVDLMDFLPPHLKARYERAAAGKVESAG